MAVARTGPGKLPRGRPQTKLVGVDMSMQKPQKKPEKRPGKKDKEKNNSGGQLEKLVAGTGALLGAVADVKRKRGKRPQSDTDINVPLELVQNAGILAAALLVRYWRHVRPVFQRRSALRGRLRRGHATFADMVLCVLAAGFVVTLVLVGVVVFRVLVVVGTVCQMTSSGLSKLMGV